MDNYTGEIRPLEGEDTESLELLDDEETEEATDLGINEDELEVKEEEAENGND